MGGSNAAAQVASKMLIANQAALIIEMSKRKECRIQKMEEGIKTLFQLVSDLRVELGLTPLETCPAGSYPGLTVQRDCLPVSPVAQGNPVSVAG